MARNSPRSEWQTSWPPWKTLEVEFHSSPLSHAATSALSRLHRTLARDAARQLRGVERKPPVLLRPDRPSVIDPDSRRRLDERSRHSDATILEPQRPHTGHSFARFHGRRPIQRPPDLQPLRHPSRSDRTLDAADQY